ncbi:MAG: ATPase [Chloroflexi bacterium]|nr:ATPase [Chloroflexota bacterium]
MKKVAKRVGKMTVERRGDRELVLTREFDAPLALVFEAFTKAEHIVNWWGPRRYATIVERLDLRPGGKWRFINREANGTEHGFRGEFREVMPPERLVWTFEYEGFPGHISVETATFEERNGKTLLTARAVYSTPEDLLAILQTDMAEGAAESYDRLEELLQKLSKGKRGRK